MAAQETVGSVLRLEIILFTGLRLLFWAAASFQAASGS